ncbi:MAG: class I SAM-dependent methyltransferase [Chloroflexi bacterium]|nr:class I SAM-dependent methyltransferase [Chloroflexota bacterium]
MPAESRHRTTPSLRKPESIVALRRALDGAGYTFATVRDVLGADDTLLVLPHQVPLANRRLGDGPLGTLIRLFLVDGTVTPEQAARALAPLGLEEAVGLGIVTLGRSRVHGAMRLVPAEGSNASFVFASDLDAADPSELPADFVMGVTESSRLLACLTVRRPVERVLDLGTGCGYQAILAAHHAQQVVATDVNPRAVAFARFNAVLNGATNIEVRTGDRFAAVEGEMFDQIVSNPPFVISPDRAFTYRDSGLHADDISHELVRLTPGFLRAGGLAHLLVSWIHPHSTAAEDDWVDPLRGWVAEAPEACDAWFLRKGSYDPLAYAIMWNQRLALANQMPKYLAAVDRWTRYFEHLGVGALAWGAVWLRRRDVERPRIRCDELPESSLDGDAAGELVRLLETDDVLEDVSDAALMERGVTVPGDQRLEQVMRWNGGAFRTVDASLVRETGLKPRAEIDPPLAGLLATVDGSRTIGQVIEQLARALGGTPDAVSAQVLPAVRQLVSHGFLTLT